jgi:hypothetical protein
VAGYTGERADYTVYRALVSWLNRAALFALFGLRVRNPQYIQLYRVSLLHSLTLEYTGSAMLFGEILIKARRRGARIVQVPVRYVPRTGGRATGAKTMLILRTGRDLLHLWWRSITGKLA